MAKKKVKLNDKVNTKNKKGINIDKYETDEAKEVKRFVFILLNTTDTVTIKANDIKSSIIVIKKPFFFCFIK